MNKERLCQFCGEISDTTGKYCQKCYNYLKIHPEGRYDLPPKGQVVYAINGDPICAICGMAYRKLGNHIRFKHKMTQNEYRDIFGLYHNTKLSNDGYKNLMRKYNKRNYDRVVKGNLLEKGVNTRTTNNYKLPGRKIGNNCIKERVVSEVNYSEEKN